MENVDWTQIFLAILTIISALVTGFLIPYLRAKLTDKQKSDLAFWLDILVAAAETAYGSGQGKEKKEWVLMRLKELGIQFDEQIISDAIEAFVRELTASGVINNGEV